MGRWGCEERRGEEMRREEDVVGDLLYMGEKGANECGWSFIGRTIRWRQNIILRAGLRCIWFWR